MFAFPRTSISVLAVAAVVALSACDDDDNSTGGMAVTPSPTSVPGFNTTPTPSPTPMITPAPAPTPPPAEVERGAINILLTPADGSASSAATTGCVMCGVDNLDAVLDPNPDNFATANLDIALLNALGSTVDMGAELSLTVTLNEVIEPSVERQIVSGDPASPLLSPSQPGFVVSFPDISTLTLSLAPSILIEALRGGEVVAGPEAYGFGFFDALVLATPLQDINNARVFLGVQTDQPYDGIRLTLSGTLADVFLPVNIHQTGLQGFAGSISGDF